MKKLIPIILLLAALCALTACTNSDKIPDTGASLPPHVGTYTNASCGSLEFNGDGKTVSLILTPTFAEKTGLPDGPSEGEYVFTFGSRGACNYDAADRFSITVGGVTADITNVIAGDVKTGFENIVLTFPGEDEVIVFARG